MRNGAVDPTGPVLRVPAPTRLVEAMKLPKSSAAFGVDWENGNVFSVSNHVILKTPTSPRPVCTGRASGYCRPLMSRPELLVLDEPTSGLDPLMQEVAEGLLREVVKDGRSVFFSSHDLAEVEQVCHRVAMLRGGCVIDVFDLAERRRIAAQRITVTFAGSPPARRFRRHRRRAAALIRGRSSGLRDAR